MARPVLTTLAVGAAAALLSAACGSSDDTAGTAADDRPTLVVTTNILGDVVSNLVGDEFEVVTIMPVGTDPHDFQASAAQVAQIGEADVLIVNGADFEEGLLDVIESAEADGVPTYEAISAVEALDFADEDHADEDHADEDEDAHDHEGADPHFFTDPARMADAADGIVDFLVANVEGVDQAALESSAADYVAELRALDADVEATLDVIPAEHRVLVTNHEVFGYFADRYGFEIVGTVIPSGTTAGGADAQELARLAEVVRDEGVPAIFADTSSSDELAETLADEVGDVAIVELYSETLGADDSDGPTYVDMIRTNAGRIATALAG